MIGNHLVGEVSHNRIDNVRHGDVVYCSRGLEVVGRMVTRYRFFMKGETVEDLSRKFSTARLGHVRKKA